MSCPHICLRGRDRRPQAQHMPFAQRGTTLVVVMLLLLVMMIAALAGVRLATMDERMAGSTRDHQQAFQMAEAALRDAERMIAGDTDGPFEPLRPNQFTASCTDGLCRSTPSAPLWPGFSEADWTGTKTWAYGAGTAASVPAGAAVAPRYVIEYQGTVQPIEPGKPCIALYLIVARANGATSASQVILESVYRHRVGACYAGI